MSEGVLLYAFDTQEIAYSKVANVCAWLIRKYLGRKVSVVTDQSAQFDTQAFDQIIRVPANIRDKEWRNEERQNYYSLTPYEKTLVLDADYLLFNDRLKLFFESNYELLLSYHAQQINGCEMRESEQHLQPFGLPMCWATCFYFTKNPVAQEFFRLVDVVRDNYSHYMSLYGAMQDVYRNDFVFAVAHHLLSDQSHPVAVINPMPLVTAYRHVEILDVFEDGLLLHDKDWATSLRRMVNTNVHLLNKLTIIEHYEQFDRLFN